MATCSSIVSRGIGQATTSLGAGGRGGVGGDVDDLHDPLTGRLVDASKLRKRFTRAVERAELHVITFHELRHTFGTQMAAAGAPLRAIQEWMGHADASTTEIYAHYAPDPTAGAAFAQRAFGGLADGRRAGEAVRPRRATTRQQRLDLSTIAWSVAPSGLDSPPHGSNLAKRSASATATPASPATTRWPAATRRAGSSRSNSRSCAHSARVGPCPAK